MSQIVNISEQKRGRGRPAIFTGRLEQAIVGVIRKHGLTNGQKYLAETGVQVTPGKPKQTVNVSIPTLGKLAERNGVELKRGRPSVRKAA